MQIKYNTLDLEGFPVMTDFKVNGLMELILQGLLNGSACHHHHLVYFGAINHR